MRIIVTGVAHSSQRPSIDALEHCSQRALITLHLAAVLSSNSPPTAEVCAIYVVPRKKGIQVKVEKDRG